LVDVSFRGLKVATQARLQESMPGVGFVEVDAPLPVGTRLVVSGEPPIEVRVTGVVEQEAGAKSPPGMRLSWGEPSKVAVEVPRAPTEPVADAAILSSEPVADAAIVASEPLDGDTTGPEPVDPGSSGGFTADSTGTGDGKRRRRRKNPGRS